MRPAFWLPTCIFVSALVHVVLLTAVAVPRQRATAHGETVAVDIVSPEDVPDLPPMPEPQPETEAAPPAPAQQAPQAESAPPRAPEPQQQQQPPQQQQPAQQQRQQPPQQQAQQPPPRPQQPQQQPPQQQPAQQQPPPPEPQEAPQVRVGQENPAEQHARMSAMLNLAGPNTGDGTGAEAANKAHLTSEEVAAMRAHLRSCWKLPAGVDPNMRLKVVVRLTLQQNGALSAEPMLIEAGLAPQGPALVREAQRAARQCAPYSMLPPSKYREWRVLDIDFSPDVMTRG